MFFVSNESKVNITNRISEKHQVDKQNDKIRTVQIDRHGLKINAV